MGAIESSLRSGRIKYIPIPTTSGLGYNVSTGPLHILRFPRLFRLTKPKNRINLPNFGSWKLGTEQGTGVFDFGYFDFGFGYFGSVFGSRLFLPRVN